MSSPVEIKVAVDMLDEKKKLNALERSRRLKSLQVTENKIISRNGQIKKQIRLLNKDLLEGEKQLEIVQAERKELESQKSPVVTEHALLRYVERFMGVDLEKAHAEILALPDNAIVKHGNTVITCFTDPEDHFNLAERETQ